MKKERKEEESMKGTMFGREMVLTLLSEPYREERGWWGFVQSIRTAPTYWWLLLMVVVSLSLVV